MRQAFKNAVVTASLWALACGGGDSADSGPRDLGSAQPPAGGDSAGVGGGGDTGFGNAETPNTVPVGAAGGGSSTTPENELCEVVRVSANPVTPDMLIVLDRSGSMTQGGRWMPSVSALRRVTMELQSQIRFGLAMFPDPATAPMNVVNDLSDCIAAPDPFACLDGIAGSLEVCAPGAVVVPVALDNATVISQAFDMTLPAGGTPTGETLQGLVGTYAAPQNDPDADPVVKFILLVTDGQPTCPSGRGEDTTQADIDLANQAIEALAQNDVRTYVIGYDTSGPGNEQFASVLDGFAQRGGTGDTAHRPVEDEQSLLTEMQRIAGEVVSCSFLLEEAPPRADFVLVRLDGQQINLGEADGWELVGDRNVQLVGASCAKLQDGSSHMVDVEVRCSVVVPE